MIEITKPGTAPKDKTHHFECLACGCEAKCQGSDIQYEDRPCGGSFIVCPICKGRMREME